MTKRKAVIGLAVLCALALSAFASASASAAAGRAFTCTTTAPTEIKNFSDEHCIVPTAAGKGTRGHVLVPVGTETKISATNAKTASSTTAAFPMTLRITIAGVKTHITCKKVSGTGTLTNAATSVSGSGTLNYTECEVVEPMGKGCVVGSITAAVKATTVGQTENNKLKFEPSVAGGNLATIHISGCANEVPPAANYPLTGSFVATTEGATTSTTLAGTEAENKLKVGGNKAGLEGKITISMEGGEPLVLT
jgi:hypothetical protein